MAPLRGAGQASFDATFEMDSDDEFSGFYAKKVELAVTVYSGMATVNCPNFGRSGHSNGSCAYSVVCSSPIYLWWNILYLLLKLY